MTLPPITQSERGPALTTRNGAANHFGQRSTHAPSGGATTWRKGRPRLACLPSPISIHTSAGPVVSIYLLTPAVKGSILPCGVIAKREAPVLGAPRTCSGGMFAGPPLS